MANQEHLSIVQEGARSVSRWRESGPSHSKRLDLSHSVLSGLDLSNIDLSNDDLNHADLRKCDLRNSKLSYANLAGALLDDAVVERSNLSGADLKTATLVGANLRGVLFTGCDLTTVDLASADASASDFSGCNLSNADLTLTDMKQSDLTGANLMNARLTGTNLDLANLSGADLRCANLNRVSANGTLFTSVRMGMTVIGDSDLSGALDLESARHSSSSTIGLNTLVRSNGNISMNFLIETGLPDLDKLIGYTRDSANSSLRVIILGSYRDATFMTELKNEIAKSGANCWYMPVGDEDKLVKDISFPPLNRLGNYDVKILVCSENSYRSPYTWKLFNQVMHAHITSNGDRTDLIGIALDKTILSNRSEGLAQMKTFEMLDFSDGDKLEGSCSKLREVIGKRISTL